MSDKVYYGSTYSAEILTLEELQNCSFANSYDFKPEFTFNSVDGVKTFYGIELELASEIKSKSETAFHALSLLNENRRFFYAKHDGSVSPNGYELNSFPSTLPYYDKHFTKELWDEVVDKAGYFANGTCGYHIHIDKRAFNNYLSTGGNRLDRFLGYLVVLRPLLLAMSERKNPNHFSQYADFFSGLMSNKTENYVDVSRYASYYTNKVTRAISQGNTPTTRIPQQMLNKCVDSIKEISNDTRYTAINLGNHGTVELRIFAGTVDHSKIMGILHLVDHLVNLAKEGVDIFSVSDFLMTIKDKPRLSEFVNETLRTIYKTVRRFSTLLNTNRLLFVNSILYYRVANNDIRIGDMVCSVGSLKHCQPSALKTRSSDDLMYDLWELNNPIYSPKNARDYLGYGNNKIVFRPFTTYVLELVDKKTLESVTSVYVKNVSLSLTRNNFWYEKISTPVAPEREKVDLQLDTELSNRVITFNPMGLEFESLVIDFLNACDAFSIDECAFHEGAFHEFGDNYFGFRIGTVVFRVHERHLSSFVQMVDGVCLYHRRAGPRLRFLVRI